MHRIIITIFSLFAISMSIHSQVEYYKNSKSIIKRIEKNLYSITKIHDDGNILYTGYLESDKPLVKTGAFSFYSKSGNLTAFGKYDQDILVGEWIYLTYTLDSNGIEHYDSLIIVDYDYVHDFMRDAPKIDKEAYQGAALIFIGGKPCTEPVSTFDRGKAYAEFHKYVKKNMIYPAYERYEGIEGNVSVEIYIDEEGKLQKPRTFNSSHYDFSMEVLRLVIESSGCWAPYMKDGKPIKSTGTPLVYFRLD